MKSSFLLNHQLETQKYPLLYAQRGKYVSRLSLDKKLTAHNGCVSHLLQHFACSSVKLI